MRRSSSWRGRSAPRRSIRAMDEIAALAQTAPVARRPRRARRRRQPRREPGSLRRSRRGARNAHRRSCSPRRVVLDADRSDYDENDVARRVLDHLRFLDAASVAALRVEQLDSLQSYAEMQRARAPFDVPAALGRRRRASNRCAATSPAYGISSPPRHRARSRARQRACSCRRSIARPPRNRVPAWSTCGRHAPDEPSPRSRRR